MIYVKAYVGALVAFVLLDALWLGVITRGYYRRQIGHLMAESPNWPAAVSFYALYLAGIVFLAIAPALDGDSWARAVLSGAVFGLVAYGTYDMTNLAVMREWPLGMTVVDMVWGTLLTATAAAAGFAGARLGA